MAPVGYLPPAAPEGVVEADTRVNREALTWRCSRWRRSSASQRRLHAPSSWPGSILIGHGRSPLALTSKSSNGCGWRFFGCGRSCSSHEASSRSNRPRPGRHKGVSWASCRPSGTSQTFSRWGCGYRWVLWLVTACTRVARSPHRSWCISPTGQKHWSEAASHTAAGVPSSRAQSRSCPPNSGARVLPVRSRGRAGLAARAPRGSDGRLQQDA